MADKKIADLTESTTPTDADIMIVEDNANTKKITIANLKTLLIGALSSALGNRTYTEDNYVTDSESITNSLDALDMALKDLFDYVGEGGIESSGSNALGTWTRWNDGRMICEGIKDLGTFNIDTTDGTLKRSAPFTVTFPQTFISPPSFDVNTTGTGLFFIKKGDVTTTSGTFVITTTAVATNRTEDATFICVGWWK